MSEVEMDKPISEATFADVRRLRRLFEDERCPTKRELDRVIRSFGYLPVEPVQLEALGDEEIIGDFCKTCDYSIEGCIERGQQVNCSSYQEALRQKRQISQATIAYNDAKGQLYRVKEHGEHSNH